MLTGPIALAQSPMEDLAPTPTPAATPAPSPSPSPLFTDPTPVEPTPTPAATATATATPAAAASPTPKPEPRWKTLPPYPRESGKWFSAELGGAGLQLEGDIASRVYGDDFEPAFHGRMGVLLFSILDLGLSVDATQISARRVGTGDGTDSAEISRLTLVPIAASAIARLDFFPNQPVVPYAGAGFGYLVWSERNPIEDEQVDGDKQGVVLMAGVQILLDWMEQPRADDLDNWWGVNDTYLALEVARTTYGDSDDQEGLDLGHISARASFLFEF
jgi:opacity protein-like surface antigen